MSGKSGQAAGAAQRGDGVDDARRAKARRNAWLLGGFALCFFLGYIVWMYFQAAGGG